MEVPTTASLNTSENIPAATLEFLGPEMASLQELLASLSTGEASARDSPGVESSQSPSSSPSVHMPSPFPITSSIDIQNSAVHKMAACGDLDALRMLILDHGADVNLPMKDGTTPVHCAVENGRKACLQLLLDNGGNENALRDDHVTPVHIAAAQGDVTCLQILLEQGAAVNTATQSGDTPLHLAVDGGHLACCRLLLHHGVDIILPGADNKDHSVLSIASPACKAVLHQMGKESSGSVCLTVELKTQLEGATVSCTHIGNVDIWPSTSWHQLEDQLRAVLSHFLTQLDQGLRIQSLGRRETESACEVSKSFTLGITMRHINMFEMGFYRWSPGMQTGKMPYSIASNNVHRKIAIVIDDTDNLCELIAFDILHPVSALHEYLHLLQEHKSVVFHGPVNSGKSYLVQRLAQCLASEQKAAGEKPAIYQLKLSSKNSFEDFIAYLLQKGCLLRTDQETTHSPILILDNLEKVNMASIFGPLLDPVAYRGIQHAFFLTESLDGSGKRYYFPENFCILATLNGTRSTGIELHVQQHFRWVQFHHDAEPLRNLLARHFLRRLYHLGDGKLPQPDDPLLRATEWIICIWQHLNDSLQKLGLLDMALGPCCFFKCPIEKRNPQLILLWVRELWNSVITNHVLEAMKKGAGGEAECHGQHKVASTTLYVLLQRAIVLSCPLPAKDKVEYLQSFRGSSDLDLPFKSDKMDQRSSGGRLSQLTAAHHMKSAHHSKPDKELFSSKSWPLSPSSSPLHIRGWPQDSNTSASPAAKAKNDREERERSLELFMGSNRNIKRHSLSESNVSKTSEHLDLLEQQGEENRQQQLQGCSSLSHHTKVPKLEVQSSESLSLSQSFKTSLSALGEGKVGRVSPVQLAGRLSSHHHHYHHHKKSKSSENITHSGLHTADKFNSQNPFPFSLNTPKSSLASFTFFKKQQPELCAEPLSSTSSVCVEGMTEPTVLSCLQMQLTESVETSAQVAGAVSKEEGPTTQWTDGGQTADHSHS